MGITYGGSAGSAFALNSSISGLTLDATIKGSEMVLRSALSYGAVSRSVGAGSKAFADASKFVVQNMMRSMAKKIEIQLMYGQVGIGTVDSISTNTLTITTAEWAPGIWAGSENMPVEIRNAALTVSRGTANVVSVDLSAKTVTLDVAPGGVVATDVIFPLGAYGNEFAGIHKIVANTGSLFGIDASQYNLWKGNSYSAGSAALTFNKIQSAIAKAVEKGLEGDVLVLVNPSAWSSLLNEQAALRKFDYSYSSKEMENGAQKISFFGQNGMIEIVPSIYCKEGYGYVLFMDDMMRIGSTDVTFKRPGSPDEFFRELENNAGYELRCYTDQALFTHSPGKCVLITNIVNP